MMKIDMTRYIQDVELVNPGLLSIKRERETGLSFM